MHPRSYRRRLDSGSWGASYNSEAVDTIYVSAAKSIAVVDTISARVFLLNFLRSLLPEILDIPNITGHKPTFSGFDSAMA